MAKRSYVPLVSGLNPVLLAMALLTIATSAASAVARPLAPEEVVGLDEYPSATWGALSPDGHYFVYTIRRSGSARTGTSKTQSIPPTNVGADLRLVDTKTGKEISLTSAVGSNWGASWSPNGKRLAFFSDRDGQLGLWIWESGTRGLHRLGVEPVYSWAQWERAAWLPDGTRIVARVPGKSESVEVAAVTADASAASAGSPSDAPARVVSYSTSASGGEAAQVHFAEYSSGLAVFDVTTGSVSRVAENVGIGAYKISPDGMSVAVTSRGPVAAANKYLRRWKLEVISLRDGARRTLASDILQEQPAGTWFGWAPDSRAIAYTDIGSQGYKNESQTPGEVYVVSVADASRWSTKGTSHPSFGDDWRSPYWSPDGNSIYVIGGGAIWALDRKSRSARELVHMPGREIAEIVRACVSETYASADHGRSMLALVRDSSSMSEGLWRIDLTSHRADLLREAQASFGRDAGETIAATADGATINYRSEAADRYPNYWIADGRLRRARQVTHVNAPLERVELGKSKLVEWRSPGGEALKGVLLLPPNYQAGRRYPVIVDVYGGADPSQALNEFDIGFDMKPTGIGQFLASRGYAIFRPGSILHAGTPMRDIADSVLSGVDAVERLGVADPSRLGVIGHSYGGYSALALVVQTNRFKAAVVNQGQGNLINYAYRLTESGDTWTSVAEDGQARLGKSLWEDRARYIENSPLFFLDRVQTPLLIIHGAQDSNTPAYQADQIFAGLKRLGRTAEYVKYLDEGHNFYSYSDNVDVLRRLEAWFSSHL